MNELSPNSALNLTQHTSRAVFWSMGGNIGVSAIRFVGTMVIARILAPEEFGIIGMAMLFVGLIGIFGNLGMSAALIQMKDVDEEYKSTSFWTNMIVGTVLFLITVLLAWPVAVFFNESAIKLVLIVLAANYIFSSLALTQATLLYKELRFKEIALIEISLGVVRVIIIVLMAFAGMGFWSLVWGTVIERILKTICLVNLSPWKPKFIFSREKFNRLFHFGKNIYGQSFVNYFSENIDFIIVGRVLGAQSLAYYQFAYNLPHLVLQHINASIDAVTFPVFSKIQDEKERLAGAFLKSTKYVSIVTFPLMAGLSFVAKDFIVTAYGFRWEAAVLPLQILCLSGAIRSVAMPINPVLQAVGRPDISLKCAMVFTPFVVALIVSLSRWGTVGVAVGMTAASFLYLIVVRIGVKLVGESLRRYLVSLFPAALCSVMMIVFLFAFNRCVPVTQFSGLIRLGINIGLGGGFYLMIFRVLFRDDCDDMRSFVRMTLFNNKT